MQMILSVKKKSNTSSTKKAMHFADMFLTSTIKPHVITVKTRAHLTADEQIQGYRRDNLVYLRSLCKAYIGYKKA